MNTLKHHYFLIIILVVLISSCKKEFNQQSFDGCYACYGYINTNLMSAYVDSNGQYVGNRDTTITSIENTEVCISELNESSFQLYYSNDSLNENYINITLNSDNSFNSIDVNLLNALEGNYYQNNDSIHLFHCIVKSITIESILFLNCNKK